MIPFIIIFIDEERYKDSHSSHYYAAKKNKKENSPYKGSQLNLRTL